LSHAAAFIFAALEDFGIVLLEAQACGTPVIAYGRGGALETIQGLQAAHPTGCFFKQQTAQAIREAVEAFEQHKGRISPQRCRENAQSFSISRFRNEFASFVEAVQGAE